MEHLVTGADGHDRCSWGAEPAIYRDYHDTEWGVAETNDRFLFEKLCLEGFQAGLSWLTILRKRDAFREAFAGFDPAVVAGFGDDDVSRLLGDASIVRHEGKIRSVVNNAARCIELAGERGSLADFVWEYADPSEEAPGAIPATTPASQQLAAALKGRGWTFVGPTTVYAFMQSMGLVNDHVPGCWVREACAARRRETLAARE